ncbi:MAG: tetratricopeptide repeat protein [Deltaproteobacteria bacterium]
MPAVSARPTTRHEDRSSKGKDAFVEMMEPFADGLEKNWRLFAIGLGVLLVLAIGVAVSLSLAAGRKERAAQSLGEALADVNKPIVGAAETPDKAADSFQTEKEQQQALEKSLQAVVTGQAGTRSAQTALLSLGDAQYRLGDFTGALGSYAKFLDQAPPEDTLRAFAMQGEAFALLGAGKGDDALAAAKKLSQEPPAGFGRDLGLLAEGRIAQQLGKVDEAKEAFQKLVTDFPSSAAGREASARLVDLGVNPKATAPFGMRAP